MVPKTATGSLFVTIRVGRSRRVWTRQRGCSPRPCKWRRVRGRRAEPRRGVRRQFSAALPATLLRRHGEERSPQLRHQFSPRLDRQRPLPWSWLVWRWRPQQVPHEHYSPRARAGTGRQELQPSSGISKPNFSRAAASSAPWSARSTRTAAPQESGPAPGMAQ